MGKYNLIEYSSKYFDTNCTNFDTDIAFKPCKAQLQIELIQI